MKQDIKESSTLVLLLMIFSQKDEKIRTGIESFEIIENLGSSKYCRTDYGKN